MLVLTEAAAEVVKSLTSIPRASDGAGLRIESHASDTGSPGKLEVSAAPGPSEDDQVIESGGAHVYLEPQAAAYLADKVLDATVDSAGNAHFTLSVQDQGRI